MVISTGKRSLALQLRKQGLSIREIADKVNANKSSVGEWLKGVKSGQDGLGLDRHQGQSPSLVPSVQRRGKDKGKSNNVQVLPGRTGKVNQTGHNGGYIVVWFVVALLVLFLLDHFVLEGKILAYIRSYFSEEEEAEIPPEKVPELTGFEGRALED
ncbi:hypothetical protein ES705_37940 [subsurface metagenome]